MIPEPTGDPASLSTAGAAILRAAERLRRDGEVVRSVVDDLAGHWSGRGAVAGRRRGGVIADGLIAASTVLERAGRALQEHAADLAEAQQRAREVAAAAHAEGLVVVEGRVRPPWGVSGVAHASAEAHREDVRVRLQGLLDVALLQVQRRRERLAATAEEARAALAAVSADVRRQ